MIGRIGSETDTGRKRRRNEDSFVVNPPLFAVADGMGGAQAGEVASRLAATVLQEAPDPGPGEEHVIGLIQEANRRVYQRGREDASASGLGTTITVALVENGQVRIGHVGDSRAYLVRDGSLEQLTDDHSLVAELVRSGKLSPEEAESHPQRSVITRALGTDPDVDVDAFTVETRPGDVFLICSDGLTSMVDDARILEIVERNREDLDRAAKLLIKEANRGGGEDNITVVAFEIADEPDETTREYGDADETLKMDAAATTAAPDDEDTLDELDRVPAVDTMVVSPEDARRMWERANIEAAPAGRPAARRAWRLLLLVVLAAVIVAAVVAWRLLS